MSLPIERYTSKSYFVNNPTWDIEDSPWKANFVTNILHFNGILPRSICDIGCGAGAVLVTLRGEYPDAELYGYDMAPDVSAFWLQHKQEKINFFLFDFLGHNVKTYDVILLLDVIEHISDPFHFLENLSDKAKYFVFHIPLDLSVINILREKPILNARKKTGHINYFTKSIALSLIEECGFKIVEWRYSRASFTAPKKGFKTQIANISRRFLCAINKELGVKVLGGETLFVLAQGSNP